MPARPQPQRQNSSTPPGLSAGWRVIRRRLTDIADNNIERSPEEIAEQERKRAERRKEEEAFKRERHDCRTTGEGPETQAWIEGRQVRRLASSCADTSRSSSSTATASALRSST